MKNYIIYNATGRIVQTGVVPDSMFDNQRDEEGGRFILEGDADFNVQYVVGGAVVWRPLCPAVQSASSAAADGIGEVVLWQVPAGAEVVVSGPVGGAGLADGSNFRMTFARPGVYKVRVLLFPYRDWEGVIDAT